MLDKKTYEKSNSDLNIDLLNDLGNELLELGANIVVIKLGNYGLYLYTGDLTNCNQTRCILSKSINIKEWENQKILAPCLNTEVLGTTGAGDATIAGSGLSFNVLTGRGMGISSADYKGNSLCWLSSTGEVAPEYYEPETTGWLRSFYGGLLATCGLTYVGGPKIKE